MLDDDIVGTHSGGTILINPTNIVTIGRTHIVLYQIIIARRTLNLKVSTFSHFFPSLS